MLGKMALQRQLNASSAIPPKGLAFMTKYFNRIRVWKIWPLQWFHCACGEFLTMNTVSTQSKTEIFELPRHCIMTDKILTISLRLQGWHTYNFCVYVNFNQVIKQYRLESTLPHHRTVRYTMWSYSMSKLFVRSSIVDFSQAVSHRSVSTSFAAKLCWNRQRIQWTGRP